MRTLSFFLITALMSLVDGAQAAIYRVGPDAGCTHATIQAAVNAAQSNPGTDTILISSNVVWTQQDVLIDTDQSLNLVGGYLGCSDFTSGSYTTLDGAGGSANPVLRIRGTAGTLIQLSFLIIRNGDPSIINGAGGGINYDGSGILRISDSAVINNTANKGGGIYANGQVDSALLVIGANVGINGNTAVGDGGGVFVNGMTVEMAEADSIIAFNHALGDGTAKGYGGGLAVRSTGSREGLALVSSPGLGTLGAIYGNDAKWGGGIAVSAGADADADATLNLFTRDASRPAAIRGNLASEGGGAIFVWPNQNAFGTAFATARVLRAEITDNAAPEGAVAYLDDSSSVDLSLGGFMSFIDPSRDSPPAGALPCPEGVPCSRVSGNVAETANGVATDGALFYLDPEAALSVFHGTLFSGNRSGRFVDSRSDAYEFLRSVAILGNEFSREMFRLFSGTNGSLDIIDGTIAGNSLASTDPVIQTSNRGEVQLLRSIIWQPGHAVLNSGGGTPTVEYVIANEVGSIGGGPNAVIADPRFIDPERGDYRLLASSPAIDRAPPIVGDDRDALGLPRDRGLPVIPNPQPSRVRDIGAYERQSLLPLILNGDFAGDTHFWFLPVGHAGNFQVNNAPGSAPDTGSAQVAGTSNAGRLLGYAQCLRIPGPGLYALNGSARTEGDPLLANPTALIWELRADGGDGCIDGAISAGGTHDLNPAATTDQWYRPANPALIDVPASIWNFRTSLTVIMAVYPNASNNSYNGLFDGIGLDIASTIDDRIFADGFEP